MSFDPPDTPGHDGDVLVNDDNSEPNQRPWGPVRRTLSVLAGLVLGALVFVVGGFTAGLTGCTDFSETLFCPDYGWLATALEIAVLVPGVIAPLAGGIASSVTFHPRWLARGSAVGLIAYLVLLLVARGQEPLLS